MCAQTHTRKPFYTSPFLTNSGPKKKQILVDAPARIVNNGGTCSWLCRYLSLIISFGQVFTSVVHCDAFGDLWEFKAVVSTSVALTLHSAYCCGTSNTNYGRWCATVSSAANDCLFSALNSWIFCQIRLFIRSNLCLWPTLRNFWPMLMKVWSSFFISLWEKHFGNYSVISYIKRTFCGYCVEVYVL